MSTSTASSRRRLLRDRPEAPLRHPCRVSLQPREPLARLQGAATRSLVENAGRRFQISWGGGGPFMRTALPLCASVLLALATARCGSGNATPVSDGGSGSGGGQQDAGGGGGG